MFDIIQLKKYFPSLRRLTSHLPLLSTSHYTWLSSTQNSIFPHPHRWKYVQIPLKFCAAHHLVNVILLMHQQRRACNVCTATSSFGWWNQTNKIYKKWERKKWKHRTLCEPIDDFWFHDLSSPSPLPARELKSRRPTTTTSTAQSRARCREKRGKKINRMNWEE